MCQKRKDLIKFEKAQVVLLEDWVTAALVGRSWSAVVTRCYKKGPVMNLFTI